MIYGAWLRVAQEHLPGADRLTAAAAVFTLILCAILSAGVNAQSVADALPARVAAHDASRSVQQQIDALRGKGPSQAQKTNDQALATALATARARLEQAQKQSAQLNARLEAQRQTQAGLVPLLEHMLDLLAQSVRADLPVNVPQRLGAIASAREALSDADLSATQRFEAVLNIYNSELRLNHTTATIPATLDTAAGARAVHLLRVGRIALYAVTDDRSYCAVFRQARGEWETLRAGLCQQLSALGERLEQAPVDGLPLSVPAAR